MLILLAYTLILKAIFILILLFRRAWMLFRGNVDTSELSPVKNEKEAWHHGLNQGSAYSQTLEQSALNFCLRNTTLPLCRKCTFFFSSCVFHTFCEEFERCRIALVITQTPTRQSVSKFYFKGKKKNNKPPLVSQPASAVHSVLPALSQCQALRRTRAPSVSRKVTH